MGYFGRTRVPYHYMSCVPRSTAPNHRSRVHVINDCTAISADKLYRDNILTSPQLQFSNNLNSFNFTETSRNFFCITRVKLFPSDERGQSVTSPFLLRHHEHLQSYTNWELSRERAASISCSAPRSPSPVCLDTSLTRAQLRRTMRNASANLSSGISPVTKRAAVSSKARFLLSASRTSEKQSSKWCNPLISNLSRVWLR